MNYPRIAIYYKSLENVGGIERVIIELSRIFQTVSSNIVLLTSEPIAFLADKIQCNTAVLPKDSERSTTLKRILEEMQAEWLIVHDPSSITLLNDIEVAHMLNCKVALMVHFSFQSPIIFNEAASLYSSVLSVGSKADAIACVSALDAECWSSLGLNAYHVQNPFIHNHVSLDNNTRKNPHEIIWIGRGVPQKRPFDAIKILHLVTQKIPDVHLVMVGVGQLKHALKEEAERLNIADNVIFIEQTSDPEKFYQTASLHLLTSITESFCLVLAEAKQHGIPSVMYRIPFLDLVADGKGIISHEHGDVAGMADSIVNLFLDASNLNKLSQEARESINKFNDANVLDSWYQLFYKKRNYNNSISPYAISELVRAWNLQLEENKWKIDFCDYMEKILFHKFKSFASFMTKGYRILAYVKRSLK
ncbi:glycosyltransferase [Duncaniella muris]|uniref:glycosyltransferase n=1 Tax=Duncaniella muris TaxID=2094150 RepID=UPI001C3E15F1|nr:glycosyltransferase [Duncaniella muris]